MTARSRKMVRMENDARGLRFAGVIPLKQSNMQVSWDNLDLSSQWSPLLERRVDATLLVALVQIDPWPMMKHHDNLLSTVSLHSQTISINS